MSVTVSSQQQHFCRVKLPTRTNWRDEKISMLRQQEEP
jgi:hypothetical protein